ncbi:ABC transporter substrate-binding protein [uncultured Ferrovibrio sp.]|jgi:NitT/TauT family transport system substrate-binding protein|uniref:ABC transporter substrate-binding protein n=1 Tax=uncultured Ferrovibrio sp. TaxID=1576913 RepID=UPI002627923E|nr:ABC transporter substrate-binding protein [uncultured Ferrovibrio sp.]
MTFASRISRRGLAYAAAGLALTLGLGVTDAAEAQTKLKFTLDWAFQGPTSAFLLAEQKGYYKAEGIDITIDAGQGSAGALQRVATGAYEMGYADINALIEYNVKNPDAQVKAVMMGYDAPPFGVYALKSSGIKTPKDLAGKKLGAPVFDASFKLFPAFAAKIGIDKSTVTHINLQPPLREPSLKNGSVDFISGHYFSSILDLEKIGVKEDEIVSFAYSDYGMDFYGNAVIASPKFIKENPAAIKGVVKATIKAWQEIAANPELGIKATKTRDGLTDEALEMKRLKLSLERNVLTKYVKENGFGGVDMARLQRSSDAVAQAVGLPRAPKAEELFDDSFLPPKAERMMP